MEWAAVELDDGSQWILAHPSAGPPEGNFLYVRGLVQRTRIETVAQRFLDWLKPGDGEIEFIYEDWPYDPRTP